MSSMVLELFSFLNFNLRITQKKIFQDIVLIKCNYKIITWGFPKQSCWPVSKVKIIIYFVYGKAW